MVLVDGQGRVRAVENVETPDAQNRLISALTVLLNNH